MGKGRSGNVRPMPPRWVIIHTSEGSEGLNSAEQLAGFLGQPATATNVAGYHAVADTDMHVIRVVPDDRVAFAAPGSNTEGLHICIPARAGQTREQWLEGSSRSAIRTVAGYLLDTRDRYGIPVERLTVAELRAGTRGYADHAAIRDAFGRTTHWDVGPGFPWETLYSDIRDLRPPPNPQQESELYDMAGIAALYIPDGNVRNVRPNAKTFVLCASGDIRHASMPDVSHAQHEGAPAHAITTAEAYDQLDANSRKGLG